MDEDGKYEKYENSDSIMIVNLQFVVEKIGMCGGANESGSPLPVARRRGSAVGQSLGRGGGAYRSPYSNAQEPFTDDILTTIRHRTTYCMATS